MKKIILTVLFAIGYGCGLSYAGGVTDDNSGNQGYILVSTGENNGANTVGHWEDPSFLKGEKGEKGDTGATGAKGDKGDKGDTGENGIAGLNGENGINGEKGDKGDTGAQGKDVDPETVNTINNNISNTNTAVANTNNRIDGLNNRVADLERTQYIVGGVLRIYDSRKWQINLFADYTTTRNTIDRAGIRFTYKFGKSYEEQRLDDLEHKLNRVLNENDRLYREANAQPYVTKNGIGIRETHRF